MTDLEKQAREVEMQAHRLDVIREDGGPLTLTDKANLKTAAKMLRSLAFRAAQPGEGGWQPIATAPNQTTVLVCNDCLLGWWAVAIQCALGEWWYEDGRGRFRLKHAPTHWREVPSIQPIALRKGRRHEQ